jgi:hypothetical protein
VMLSLAGNQQAFARDGTDCRRTRHFNLSGNHIDFDGQSAFRELHSSTAIPKTNRQKMNEDDIDPAAMAKGEGIYLTAVETLMELIQHYRMVGIINEKEIRKAILSALRDAFKELE